MIMIMITIILAPGVSATESLSKLLLPAEISNLGDTC